MPNAFDWKGAPSTFTSGDPNQTRTFRPTKTGLSFGQVATINVIRREGKAGFNSGSIAGLSARGDQQLLTPAERKARRGR